MSVRAYERSKEKRQKNKEKNKRLKSENSPPLWSFTIFLFYIHTLFTLIRSYVLTKHLPPLTKIDNFLYSSQQNDLVVITTIGMSHV
jgi:hypothetical protein